MVSFYDLLQKLDEQNIKGLLDSGEETNAMQAIRHAKNIDPEFWEKFIRVLQATEAVADLLNVRVEDVKNWSSKIKQTIDDVKHHDQQPENEKREKATLLPTGQNGALTV